MHPITKTFFPNTKNVFRAKQQVLWLGALKYFAAITDTTSYLFSLFTNRSTQVEFLYKHAFKFK